MEKKPASHTLLDRLDRVIEQNILHTDIDMPFLTDKMAMSHSTLYRRVKSLTGLTAQTYVCKVRLRVARRMIESGECNVTEAAMATGFNHMAHFREVFTREFGFLPSEARKKRL